MSTFAPTNFEEAKLAFKPLRRGRMTRTGNAPSRSLRACAAVPYARNSVVLRKKAKSKKLSDGKLKKKVWIEFSRFIRTRGADSQGFNRCVTCDVLKHWKDLQAGHFLRGRLNANLFSEIGTNPQCYGCNVGKQGEVVIYYRWMVAKHGEAVIDELIAQNNKTHKWQPGELLELLKRYKSLNATNPLLQEQP